MAYFLAIDLGATSGRHIVGYQRNGEYVLDEVHRFLTGMDESKDGLVWDLPRFLQEIKLGIKKAFAKYGSLASISIDTWGVDYVLMNHEKEIHPFYAYRNKRNEIAANEVHQIIPFKDLYRSTGIQYAPYNSIYQFYADAKDGRLEKATSYLMLPEYFSYKLTGVMSHEYCDESTTGLLNAQTKNYDFDLINKLGFPKHLFKDIKFPGTYLGELLPNIAYEVGGNAPVLLCASHDTASAFEAIDIPEDGIILSSGTWSLFGIKSAKPICNELSLKNNFTNEGGCSYIRFLKNIMGMWITSQVCEQEGLSFIDLQTKLDHVPYDEIFDVNHPSLLAPKNMKKAILTLLSKNPPKDEYQLFRSIYRSMAYSCNQACLELEAITEKKYNYIYVVGGGAKNKFFTKCIEEFCQKKVVALPVEATSLGNVKIQEKYFVKGH